jgi:ABC-2 type transport system ATP-binding protein
VRKLDVADHTLRLTVDHGDQLLLGLMRALDGAGVELSSIQLSRPTLDDVFLTLTGHSLRETSTPDSGQ